MKKKPDAEVVIGGDASGFNAAVAAFAAGAGRLERTLAGLAKVGGAGGAMFREFAKAVETARAAVGGGGAVPDLAGVDRGSAARLHEMAQRMRRGDERGGRRRDGRRRIMGYSQTQDSFAESRRPFRNLDAMVADRKARPSILGKEQFPGLDELKRLQDRRQPAFPLRDVIEQARQGTNPIAEVMERGTGAARSRAAEKERGVQAQTEAARTATGNARQLDLILMELRQLNARFDTITSG